MKIYQLTLPLHRNYGGILQCWALQTVLRRMGHDVEAVDFSIERPANRIRLSMLKAKVLNLFRRKKKVLDEYIEYKVGRGNRKFVAKLIKMHQKVFILGSNLSNHDWGDADAWVVGSDQVWRKLYCFGRLYDYFLKFVPDGVKKIAYAPSFGLDNVDEYSAKDCETVARLLPRFDAVSVREKSGIDIIESKGWRKKGGVEHVLDPTLLLSADDYCNAFGLKKERHNRRRAFIYVLDGDESIIKETLESKGFDVITGISCDAHVKGILNIKEWLENLLNADLVITDSFHCIALSIIFERRFELQSNESRGNARLESLLASLGIPSRSVSDPTQFGSLTQIDYTKVNAILNAERKRCIAWLKNALSS